MKSEKSGKLIVKEYLASCLIAKEANINEEFKSVIAITVLRFEVKEVLQILVCHGMLPPVYLN